VLTYLPETVKKGPGLYFRNFFDRSCADSTGTVLGAILWFFEGTD